MITTILFDVGNVLLTFNPKDYYQPLMDAQKLNEMLALFFNGDTWNHYDQGLYTEKELKQYFPSKRPDLEKEIKLFFSTYFNLLQPIASTVNLALELKKEYRISILSNMPEVSDYFIRTKFRFFNKFELPLFSWKVKMIKPDPKIYELQMQRLNTRAEEILFIDDKQENLDAAAKLGMHTYLMKNHQKAPEEIMNYLKTVNK